MSQKNLPSSPVFYDPRGRRWRHVRRTYLALAVIVTTVVAIFIASVLAKPQLPPFNLRPPKTKPAVLAATAREAKAKKAQAELQNDPCAQPLLGPVPAQVGASAAQVIGRTQAHWPAAY